MFGLLRLRQLYSSFPKGHTSLYDLGRRASLRSFATGADTRYASILQSVAEKDKSSDKTLQDMTDLSSTLSESPHLSTLLLDPSASRHVKASILSDIAAKAGFQPSSQRFLQAVAENGRANELPGIIAAYRALLGGDAGVGSATVISAVPLSKWQLASVEKNYISQIVKQGVELELVNKVDPAIMGGVQIQVGDKFVDLSVRKEFLKVKELLQGAV
uniref:ATP synthase subunit 5, mitochondrial n=1 Tax=Timspurckia oligopyrenoides TaxID=708627 RepID=A0A7S1ETG5_9RHOD|mmetsp:Transcript_740/g.1343  ORF Transcript_740/g.1343 Transcript_740/m.1343 type:complete len:216 (+) Transcript_740:71-718(+)